MGYPHKSHPRETPVLSKHFGNPEARKLETWKSFGGYKALQAALAMDPVAIQNVVKAFLEATGCKELGLTSPDGKYTVIEVECLGACGFATPVQINEDYVENVTPEKVPAILANLK